MINYNGKKARLRPVKLSDKEYSLKWRNDPEFRELNLALRLPITEEMEDKWYQKVLDGQNHSKIVYAIEDIEDNKMVGFVILSKIDWVSGTADFGIALGEKDRRGKGIGKEAMRIFVDYVFETLNIRKLSLYVVSYNSKAIGMYKRFGFKEEGRLIDHVYLRNSYNDLLIMALFKEDYYKIYPQKNEQIYSLK